jgi:hypothetical protein
VQISGSASRPLRPSVNTSKAHKSLILAVPPSLPLALYIIQTLAYNIIHEKVCCTRIFEFPKRLRTKALIDHLDETGEQDALNALKRKYSAGLSETEQNVQNI